MMSYICVGIGGAAGAIARVALSRILPAFLLNIPLKILCVNVIGCFVMGMLTEFMALHWSASINARHLLIQGFLGGFTTFSAFSLEFGLLFEKGLHGSAIIYAILSLVLCLIFFFVGLRLIRTFS